MSEEFLCVRCARTMRTCCQTSEIYVTPGDVTRISHATGEDAEQFCEFRRPDDPVYLDSHDDDPIWLETVIREDQQRRVLRREANGDCRFLGEQGCRLALEDRPLICRLYPFDYNEQEIKPVLANGCPMQLVRPELGLLGELDMRVDDARRWHAQLYAELRLERHARCSPPSDT